MKHKVVINVSDEHGRTSVLKAAKMRLPKKLLRMLLGEFQYIYLLAPGQTVESVDIKEIKEER